MRECEVVRVESKWWCGLCVVCGVVCVLKGWWWCERVCVCVGGCVCVCV